MRQVLSDCIGFVWVMFVSGNGFAYEPLAHTARAGRLFRVAKYAAGIFYFVLKIIVIIIYKNEK